MKKSVMVPILLIFGVLVPITAAAVIYGQWKNETFYLEDIEGDAGALEPFLVTGQFSNRDHTLNFTLDGGVLETSFQLGKEDIYQKDEEYALSMGENGEIRYVKGDYFPEYFIFPTDESEIQVMQGREITPADLRQELENRLFYVCPEEGMEKARLSYKNGKIFYYDTMYFCQKPDLDSWTTFRSENGEIKDVEKTAYRSVLLELPMWKEGIIDVQLDDDGSVGWTDSTQTNLLDGLEMDDVYLNGHKYITFSTGAYNFGKMGIYDIDLREIYEAGNPYVTENVCRSYGYFGETSVDATHRILGLELVGERLMFIKTADQQVILELYDTEGGLLDSLVLEMPSPVVQYNISVQNQGKAAVINWDLGSLEYGSNVYCNSGIEIGEDGKMTENFLKQGLPWLQIGQVGDRILTVEEEGYVPYGLEAFWKDRAVPKRYYVAVYDKTFTEVLYRGEICTDAADDYKTVYGDYFTKDSKRIVGTAKNNGENIWSEKEGYKRVFKRGMWETTIRIESKEAAA